MKCKDCKWWLETNNKDRGFCHRNAPIPHCYDDYEDIGQMACWPQSEIDDYCGEFEPKD